MPRPIGIAFDHAGNVLVAEFANHHIDTFSSDGSLISQWGSDGASASSISGPGYIAINSGDHLFIAEATTHNVSQSGVQEFTAAGDFIAMIGTHQISPPYPPATFISPAGIAIGTDDRLYVTDTGNVRTQVFDADRNYLSEWPSQGNSIALDNAGHAFEVEEGGIVRKYDVSGTEVMHWGGHGSGPGQFDQPQGVGVDALGNVYVSDTNNHRVQVFTNDGSFLAQWGSFGSGPGQFDRPMGIAVAPDGTVYVADTWNGRIQVFGSLATPARSSTWGRVKAIYR